MDTSYCEKCGLLHETNDGDCLGCEMQAKIKILNRVKDDYRDFLAFIIDNNAAGDVVGCAKFNKQRYTDFISKIINKP